MIPTCGLDKSVKGVLGKYLVVDFWPRFHTTSYILQCLEKVFTYYVHIYRRQLKLVKFSHTWLITISHAGNHTGNHSGNHSGNHLNLDSLVSLAHFLAHIQNRIHMGKIWSCHREPTDSISQLQTNFSVILPRYNQSNTRSHHTIPFQYYTTVITKDPLSNSIHHSMIHSLPFSHWTCFPIMYIFHPDGFLTSYSPPPKTPF